jgi:hypothetical protein
MDVVPNYFWFGTKKMATPAIDGNRRNNAFRRFAAIAWNYCHFFLIEAGTFNSVADGPCANCYLESH